jgi:hypothetical protein
MELVDVFELSTGFSTVNSTTYPQEISVECDFPLAGIAGICEVVFTAKVLRKRSGARRPEMPERDGKVLRSWEVKRKYQGLGQGREELFGDLID